MKATIMYANAKSKWFMEGYNDVKPTVVDLLRDYTCMTEIDLPQDSLPRTLNYVFELFNMEGNPLIMKEKQQLIKVTSLHTSMSVGDVVIIDGVAYIVWPCGWGKLELVGKELTWEAVQSDDKTRDMRDALNVITSDLDIVSFLESHDPMALKQCQDALCK